MGAGVVGVEIDPALEVALGRLPQFAGLGHRRVAGMAADLEVALPLRILGVFGGELGGPLEEHVGVGDAAILEGEIAHHQVGLGILRKLDHRFLELRPGGGKLVYAQPEHRHHHAGGGHLHVV